MKSRKKIPVYLFIFIAILVILSGIRPMIVMSGSMKPAIDTGSLCLVLTEASFDNIEEGDVITYEVLDTKVTHRAAKILEEGIVTKGDDNDVADLGIVTKDNFYGKVVLSIPYLGYIAFYIKKYIWFILALLCVLAVLPSRKKREVTGN